MTNQLQALDDLIAKVEAGKETRTKIEELTIRALSLADDRIHIAMDAGASYVGSLDAAMSLHKALLPGWSAELHTFMVTVYLYGPDTMNHWSMADAVGQTENNLARAWLIAILKAYRAELADQ